MSLSSKLKHSKRVCKIKSLLVYRRFKNFLSNLSIKTKILALVVTINLLTIFGFGYNNYQSIKDYQLKELDIHLQTVAYGANNYLKGYHDNMPKMKYINKRYKKRNYKKYKNSVKFISEYAKNCNVAYVYSFMKKGENIVFTSTSATDEEFKKGEFDNFFDIYDDATDLLQNIFKKNEKDVKFENANDSYGNFRSVLIPFKNKRGYTYVVGVDIEISYIQTMLNDLILRILIIGLVVFVFSATIFIIVLNIFLKQIPIIKNGISAFFSYLNKETTSIKYINLYSQDEIGKIAQIVNHNIRITKDNIQLDNDLIDDIKNLSSSIKLGSFKYRIEKNAHSPALNEAKDVINDMLQHLQDVILSIVHLIDEYSKHNYADSLDGGHFEDEMLKLIDSINKLGGNISESMLKNAYDALALQKNANYLREFIENTIYSYDNISKDIRFFSNHLTNNDKFNNRIVNKIDESKNEKDYILKLINELKKIDYINSNREISDTISDMEYSLVILEKNIVNISTEVKKENNNIKDVKEPITRLYEMIKDNKKMAENTIKIASELSDISNRIRESIIESDFIGKDNINILMQYVDR